MIFALALAVAVVAAIRSTWSPCGVSMLSTITPLTESARGKSFRLTAWWYVAGALAGGVMLGGLAGGAAILVSRLDLSISSALLIAGSGSLIAVASDGRLFGFQLPGHDRQVNERWLDTYRNWVYGFGFGWQIGFGVATYIMTAGVYLLLLLGALSGSFANAVLLGAVFGIVRGLAVFATADIRDAASLTRFHERFEAWRRPIRQLTIAVIACIGIAAGVVSAAPAGGLLAALIAVAGASAWRSTREVAYRVPSLSRPAT